MFGSHAKDTLHDEPAEAGKLDLPDRTEPQHRTPGEVVLAVGTPVFVLPPIPVHVQALEPLFGEEFVVTEYINAAMDAGQVILANVGGIDNPEQGVYDIVIQTGAEEHMSKSCLYVGDVTIPSSSVTIDPEKAAALGVPQGLIDALIDDHEHPLLIGIPE